MTDVTGLTEKINRLKKTVTEKQPKEEDLSGFYEHRTLRKQLKRLQRRRRVLTVLSQRGKKVRPEKETKAAGKPAGKKAEAAPQEKLKEEKTKPENPAA